MRVRLSRAADEDLGDIYKYSYKHFGETQADHYYAGLWDCLGLIAMHPSMGRMRTEFRPPIRSHHYLRHIIFYDVVDDAILVIRVLHERMDAGHHMQADR